MPHLEPTYLRYIYDGLVKGSIHPENAAELPDGLIGLYEEAFDERTSVVERQKLLNRFAIWALLKKEVSAGFVAEVVGETEEEILNFISTYSAWFNSPESGKYQLYHERLKVYLLQKIGDFEIKNSNNLIINQLYQQAGIEFETYKLEFLVFHLFINEEFFQAYEFLIDYKTYQLTEKLFQSDVFLQRQIDLCIRKFAELEKESEILELIKIQFQQLDASLDKVTKNPKILFDAITLIDTIDASKKLNIKQKIFFWQGVIVELIQNLEDLNNVNAVLKIFDENLESFATIRRDSDHQFQFDGISRKNFFLLLNYLLDNNVEVKWLIDRFDWLPNYYLSRDAILDDEEYFSDFKMVHLNNKEKILKLFKESLEKKTFSDLYRSKAWCLKFISRLSDINIENQSQILSLEEIYTTKSFLQRKEQVIYSYSQKYTLSSLPLGMNDQNWRNIINDKMDDYECVKKILKELDSETIIKNEDLNCLFLDCLNDICSISEGEFADYTIQDEFLDEMILLFIIIHTNVGIDKFIHALEHFSSNFEISIWNEYLGESGALNLNETILDSVMPFIIKYDNTEQNINSLINSKILHKGEIILCFCDIFKETTLKVNNLPEFNLKDLTNYFQGQPECLFHISFCLKIELNLIYQNLKSENKLNFNSSTLFVYYSFVTLEIIKKIELQISNNLNSKDAIFLEPIMLKVIIEFLKSDLVSKEMISKLLDYLVMSSRYFDITELINGCYNKSLVYMKFRNVYKYANQLTS